MTITARNIGRINVWPTYDIAREADTEECEFVGQLTVWRTADEARANMTHEEEGGGGGGTPTELVINLEEGPGWSIVGDSPTTGHGFVGTYPFGVTFFTSDALKFTDPQDDPLNRVTLVAKSDARVQIRNGADGSVATEMAAPVGSNYYVSVCEGNPLESETVVAAGVITFTLRGEDPGGLYVEQEFTITMS